MNARYYIYAGIALMLTLCALHVIPLFTVPELQGVWYATTSNARIEIRPDGTVTWYGGYEGRWKTEARGDERIFIYEPQTPMLGNVYTEYRIDQHTHGILVMERLPETRPERYIAFGRNPQVPQYPGRGG